MSVTQLEQIISKEENVLFVKNGCQYCKKALEHAEKLKRSGKIRDYKVLTLGKDYDERALGNLVQKSGGRVDWGKATKPQIFIGRRYIGDSQAFISGVN